MDNISGKISIEFGRITDYYR